MARRSARDGEGLNLETVDVRLALCGEGRSIEIIDIGPTSHAEHLLIAWLPEDGILFEADHFGLPRVGPVPPAVQSIRDFAAALRRLELDARQILSAHCPKVASMTDLENAVELRVSMRGRDL